MTGASAGAAAAAAAGAAIANAVKASGTIVRLSPQEWRRIVARQESPLVVRSRGGFFLKNHQYLTSYKGLAFHTRSDEPIELAGEVEIVEAEKIWIP